MTTGHRPTCELGRAASLLRLAARIEHDGGARRIRATLAAEPRKLGHRPRVSTRPPPRSLPLSLSQDHP